MKHILFFGDSFASAAKDATGFGQQSTSGLTQVSYLDIVADQLGAKLLCMGHGGISWWFSYVRMKEYINKYPEVWSSVDYVVACLTNASRPKISNQEYAGKVDPGKPGQELQEDFDRWAYTKFLEEFSDLVKGKKVILLPCFQQEHWISIDYRHRFATSALDLCTISQSEIPVSGGKYPMNEILAKIGRDKRLNHLNDQNNRALAQDILEKFSNYKPGLFMPAESRYFRANHHLEHFYQQARQSVEQYGGIDTSNNNENVL